MRTISMKTACGLWLSGTIPRTWNDPLSLPVMLKWWPSTCSETIDMPLRSLLDCSLLFYWWLGPVAAVTYPHSSNAGWSLPCPIMAHVDLTVRSANIELPRCSHRGGSSLSHTQEVYYNSFTWLSRWCQYLTALSLPRSEASSPGTGTFERYLYWQK